MEFAKLISTPITAQFMPTFILAVYVLWVCLLFPNKKFSSVQGALYFLRVLVLVTAGATATALVSIWLAFLAPINLVNFLIAVLLYRSLLVHYKHQRLTEDPSFVEREFVKWQMAIYTIVGLYILFLISLYV